jgi:hypothetical protein
VRLYARNANPGSGPCHPHVTKKPKESVMKDILTAFFMICLLSTTMLNLAFTFRPAEMTHLIRDVTGL